MATVSISQLDTATQAKIDDLYEVAVVDENSQTGYASRKLTAAQIATLIAQGVQFSGLSTAAKTIIAAINEAAQNGGSEVEPNPAGEPTDTLEKIGIDGTIYEVGGSEPVSKTVTGNHISITDAADAPIVSGEVTFEPKQDLHGYDKPWAGGAGKNKLPLTVDGIKALNTTGTWSGNTYTYSGIIIGIMTDNDENVVGISVNGQSSFDFYFTILNGAIPEGSYKLAGEQNDTKTRITMNKNGTIVTNIDSDDPPFEFSSASGDTFLVYIKTIATETYSSAVVKPIIMISTETDPTFEPYSNICPISGHTEAVVTREGKNLAFVSSGNNQIIAHVKSGNTYIFTAKIESGVIIGCNWYKNSNNSANKIGSGIPFVFTADEDFDLFINGYSNTSGKTFTNSVSKFQLEIGLIATAYEPYNGLDVTVDLDGTRYGGTVDLVSGVMEVNMAMVDLGSLDWMYDPANRRFYNTTVFNATDNILCDRYQGYPVGGASAYSNTDGIIFFHISGTLIIHDYAYIDGVALKNALSDSQICYELATPFTVQLTPEQIRTLDGTNNISTNMTSMSLEYITQDYQPLVKLIERSVGHHYSTQEKVVGTWFGKTLYEKTYLWSETMSGQFYKEIDLDNPDVVFLKDGWYVTSSGESAPIPYTHPTSTYSIGVYINSAKDQLEVRCGSSMSMTTLSVTFRYTKTTS